MIAARIALVALCLAAAGWLAVQERAARAEGELTRLVFQTRGPLTPAQARRGSELLRTDRRLSLDRRPELFEAVLLVRRDRLADAITVLERATQEEPRSLEAWALLARAAARADPALAARARARLRALAPRVPPV